MIATKKACVGYCLEIIQTLGEGIPQIAGIDFADPGFVEVERRPRW